MKIIRRLIVLVLLLFVAGCTQSPESVVKTYLDTFKSNSYASLNSFINSDEYFIGTAEYNFDSSSNEELNNDEMSQKISTLMSSFDYEILGSSIDGDNAIVKVKLTTYPLSTIIQNWLLSSFQFIFANAFSGQEYSDEEMSQIYVDLFNQAVEGKTKDQTSTVDINLIKSDKKWKIDRSDNYEFIDALMGGMLSYSVQLSENFDSQN